MKRQHFVLVEPMSSLSNFMYLINKCIWQIQENWPQILIKLQYTCNWLNNTCSIKCEMLSKSFLYQIFFCSVQWHKLFILTLQLLGRPKVCQFVHRPRNNTQPWLRLPSTLSKSVNLYTDLQRFKIMSSKHSVKVCQFVHRHNKTEITFLPAYPPPLLPNLDENKHCTAVWPHSVILVTSLRCPPPLDKPFS